MSDRFPYAGQAFIIKMDNGLEVKNAYHPDGKTITIEFLNGDLLGTVMDVPFTWREVAGGFFMISWQESDKNTVVHCDNFEQQISYAYYTTMQGDFYVMEGKIS
jgi:hypothetical protein